MTMQTPIRFDQWDEDELARAWSRFAAKVDEQQPTLPKSVQKVRYSHDTRVLRALNRSIRQRASDLAKRLKMDLSTVRRTLRRLEQQGLINCETDLQTNWWLRK